MSKGQKGRVIRISHELEMYFNRHRRKGTSFDVFIRRRFGLLRKKDTAYTPATYYVLENDGSPLIFTEEAEAKGMAILRAVSKGKKRKEVERVLTVQELP